MQEQKQIEKQNEISKDESIIYISPMKYDAVNKKTYGVPLEVYVLRITNLFKTKKELYISARGNAVLRAVNLLELLKRDFGIKVKNIETFTEKLKETKNKKNRESFVSVIKISIVNK